MKITVIKIIKIIYNDIYMFPEGSNIFKFDPSLKLTQIFERLAQNQIQSIFTCCTRQEKKMSGPCSVLRLWNQYRESCSAAGTPTTPCLPVVALLPIFPIRNTNLPVTSLWVSHGRSGPSYKTWFPPRAVFGSRCEQNMQGLVPFKALCLEYIH